MSKLVRSRRNLVVASCLLALATLVSPVIPATAAPRADAAAPICPAADGNARFVRFIYLNILERCPGAAAAKFWTDKLDAGGLRWGFAESIDMSTENVGKNNVVSLYQDVLGRAPTKDEYAAGFAEIRKNHQDARLIAQIFSSDEAYAKVPGGTPAAKDKEWLKQAFNNIVDRDARLAEVTKYTAVLGSASTADTRHRVALRLELSNDNMADWTGAVIGGALHRGPTEREFQFWFGWLLSHDRQTFRLWTHMLSTPEAYALAQTQPNPDPHTGG